MRFGGTSIRLGTLAAILIAEIVLLTISVDSASLAGRAGLTGLIGQAGSWILRGLIGFAAAFIAFAGLRGNTGLTELIRDTRHAATNWLAAAAHIVTALAFAWFSATLYNGSRDSGNMLAAAWLLTGLGAGVSLCLAIIPLRFWQTLLQRTGPAWFYALAVALLSTITTVLSRALWQWTTWLTFRIVAFILLPLYPNLIVQPEHMRLRAPHFGVIIDQACSGLEGAGLMLVFLLVWLAVSRRDFRFPRALLLIPAGVGILYTLNALRIASLIIIGNLGAPGIALGGFHSQAGWIAFNGVALGMTLVVPRFDWFRTHPRMAAAPSSTSNWLADTPTAVYLLPFLAILASGMLSRATSAHFEWLYALRLAAAASVLWLLRNQLKALDWRFGWQGITAGIAVFAMWIALDAYAKTPAAPMPSDLASATNLARILWIALRALAAIITVPIAEELAFRGFLMRRLNSPDFQKVPLAQASLAGVLLSSIAFGLLHGDRWIAGVAAGLLYAFVTRHKGRIGESVVAHSVTNALLAAYVLSTGQWQFW